MYLPTRPGNLLNVKVKSSKRASDVGLGQKEPRKGKGRKKESWSWKAKVVERESELQLSTVIQRRPYVWIDLILGRLLWRSSYAMMAVAVEAESKWSGTHTKTTRCHAVKGTRFESNLSRFDALHWQKRRIRTVGKWSDESDCFRFSFGLSA